MSVDKNFIDIEESPYKLVDLEEIEGYLRYGDRVNGGNTRSASSRARRTFRVLLGPRNTPFIHYSVKLAPEDFTLEFDERENVYQTTLDIDLEVAHPRGPARGHAAERTGDPAHREPAARCGAAASSPIATTCR